METLSHILIRAKKGGFIDGFLVRGRDGVGVRYPICYLWVIPSFFMMLVGESRVPELGVYVV